MNYTKPKLRHLIALWGLLVLIGGTHRSYAAPSSLKVVTYNVHGGHGNLAVNLAKFKALLDGDEHVICLQEIGPGIWDQVKAAFPEFPYAYSVWQKTTDPLRPDETGPLVAGGGILSKLPILDQREQLIQIDPGGDLWERKAAFVKIQTGPSAADFVYLSHYHNTYNWDYNDFQSEREGMARYRALFLQWIGQASLNTSVPYVLAGDFNVFKDKVRQTLYDAPYHYGFWRDHQNSNIPMTVRKWLDTAGIDISDHNAVTVSYDYPVNR